MTKIRKIHVLLLLVLAALAWPAAGAAQAARIEIEPGYVQRFQPIDIRLTVTVQGDPGLRYEGRDGHRLIFSGSAQVFPGEFPRPQPYFLETRIDPLPPGLYNVEIRFDGNARLVASRAFEVHEASTILELRRTPSRSPSTGTTPTARGPGRARPCRCRASRAISGSSIRRTSRSRSRSSTAGRSTATGGSSSPT